MVGHSTRHAKLTGVSTSRGASRRQSASMMEHDHMPHRADTTNGSDHPNTFDGQRSFSATGPGPTYDPRPPNPSLSSAYPPPSYSQTFGGPSPPLPASNPSNPLSNPPAATELAPIQPHADRASDSSSPLPSLSSLTSQQHHHFVLAPPPAPHTAASDRSSYSPPIPVVNHWPSLNPLTAYYSPSHAQPDASQRMDVDTASSGTVSAASPDRFYDGRASSINLDDPDVRMAAEALGDLRADFISSPPARHTSLPSDSSSNQDPNSEPLLALLTTSHPLLATTIEGCTSAYNNSKIRSPTFKIGVEYFEGYIGPIVNTVGSVGRVTGVEGGVRWFLGGSARGHQHSASDLEAAQEGPHKRRRIDKSPTATAADGTTQKHNADLFALSDDRRTSMSTVDTLPPYDDARSPAYAEAVDSQGQASSTTDPNASSAWQHRLILSTSGLSVAMRAESLRSLKFCLSLLRWANEHMANVVDALKAAVEQYSEAAENGTSSPHGQDLPMSNAPPTASSPTAAQHDKSELAARINALKADVLKTLRSVIDTVSKYAGGSLPENATVLVRRHLISLPQRFWVATRQDAAIQQEGDSPQHVREGAQKILVLAKEGLDMISQVSGVLDGTIVSAEEWCERLGKKGNKEEQEEGKPGPTVHDSPSQLPVTNGGINGEVKLG